MSKLDEVIEDTMVGTANKYGSGGMYSELEQDEIDEIKNPAKAAVKALVIELIRREPTWELSTMIDAEALIDKVEAL